MMIVLEVDDYIVGIIDIILGNTPGALLRVLNR